MKLDTKTSQQLFLKKYLKQKTLIFFFNGIHLNSTCWKKTEQILSSLSLVLHKNRNNVTTTNLQTSVLRHFKEIANSIFFVMSVRNDLTLTKKHLFSNFFLSLFTLLIIKINNKVYPLTYFKKIQTSFYYKKTILLFYHYRIANLKKFSKLDLKKKIRSNVI